MPNESNLRSAPHTPPCPPSGTKKSVGGMSAPLRGVFCMTAGALVLTINDGMAKYLTESYPVGQVMALRGVSIVLLLAIYHILSGRISALQVQCWGLQLARGGFMTASTICFVTGLSYMPIADAIAITFAGPILSTALAIALLGERVDWRRWLAIFVGFLGVLIIVQPTGDAFRVAALAPLGAALFGGLRDVLTRQIRHSESSNSILLISTALVTFVGFCSYPLGWTTIQMEHVWIFAISGILVGLAQFLMIEAFRLGEVALVSPFKYTSLIWGTLIGALVWGDVPGEEIILGAGLLITGGFYLIKRGSMGRMDAQNSSTSTEHETH